MQLDYDIICQSSFKCTKQWDELTPIDGGSKIRFCMACNSSVHLTNNYEELQANIASNRCVAIFFETQEDLRPEFMGLAMPERPGAPKWVDPFFKWKFSDIELRVSDVDLSQNILDKLKDKMQLLGDLAPYTRCQLIEQFGLTVPETLEIEETFATYGHELGELVENWEIESARFR